MASMLRKMISSSKRVMKLIGYIGSVMGFDGWVEMNRNRIHRRFPKRVDFTKIQEIDDGFSAQMEEKSLAPTLTQMIENAVEESRSIGVEEQVDQFFARAGLAFE